MDVKGSVQSTGGATSWGARESDGSTAHASSRWADETFVESEIQSVLYSHFQRPWYIPCERVYPVGNNTIDTFYAYTFTLC